ncbi:MAG: DUF3298 domain-containing protein [Lentimicrobiaceae bacterium]|jgi:hypothetical protein|nr:DUF3298 domain-containing protein [Lentimicrobiaceae bacterium]MDD4597679.1 DUF3298 domain-containing protein [Lentimicrobiaceae bacterium]MDY0025561.1 DUF3298 domain-containing protein [Lentimicrobium sp.]HAH57977.1 hypothetical protein [Bacteroidales bacterium]
MKNIKSAYAFFGLIISLATQPACAQEKYQHFAGNIENGGSVYANIIVSDTNVSGYMEIPDLFEKPLYFSGTLISGNLKMATDSDSPVVFKGKYDNLGTIIGELHHNRALYPAQLDESCDEGCLPMEVHSLNTVKLLDSKPDSPVAIYHAALLEASSIRGNNLNSAIQKRFFKIKEPIPSKSVLTAAENDFFTQYIERNQSLNTAENYSRLNWEQSRIMRVIYNRNHKVSLAMHDYAYTGGSFGLKQTRFLVYDIINERELKLKDLITEDSLTRLNQMIGRKLKQDLGLPMDESLINHGYYYADIEASDNFYLVENGLVFHYNNYEIASDKGETDVLITWEQLSGLLKQGFR